MATNKKNAVINIFFQSSSIIYLVFIGIVLVPMYLKYIPVDLYGYWLASGNIIGWIGAFDPGVASVIQQRIGVSLGTKDYHKIGQYIGSSILISMAVLVILSLLLLIIYFNIFDWLGLKNIDYTVKLQITLIYAGIGTLLSLQSFGFAGINYGLQLFKEVGILSVFSNLTSIIFTFILLPAFGIKALGLAMLLRGIIDLFGNIGILWIFLKKETVPIQFSKNHTKSLFGDVAFNFFSKFGNLLSNNSQSFFITKFITPEAAVIFRFTKTIPEVSKNLIARPAAAIMPIFSKYLGQNPPIEDVKSKISQMIYYTFWSSGLVLIGFVLLNKIFIYLWVGDTFYAGNVTNILIVLWVIASTFTNNLSYTVFALGDLRRNNLVLFIDSILFIILTILLMPKLGILGIALALVISHSIISLIYYPWRLQKYIHFSRNEVKKIFKEVGYICITIAIIYIIAYKIDFLPSSWYGFIVYTIICIICYIISLYLISKEFKLEMNRSLNNLSTFLNKRNSKKF